MKCFTFITGKEIRLAPGKKVVPAEDFSSLISSQEIQTQAEEESLDYRANVAKECELLKEQAQLDGFEEGLKRWNEQIAYLEKEAHNIRKEMENAIVPLALAAVKKIIGKELELRPESIVDIVATALKTVSQHHRVTIYVNKNDLETVESHRNRLKEIFEHLHSLAIATRDDIVRGGCIIETEIGIINAQLDNQMQALESAFHTFFLNHHRKGS